MLNPRVASRYAKSILDLSIEQNKLDAIYADMLYLKKLVAASADFMNLLRSPVVNADLKIKAVDAVTDGKIDQLTKAFLHLMINKARESVLPEVISSFVDQYKVKKEIHTVKITTAVPLSDQLKNEIVAQVKNTSTIRNVEVEEVVDPAIIGGFVLQTGDQLIDASIAYDLKAISKQFNNNDFIYKVR